MYFKVSLTPGGIIFIFNLFSCVCVKTVSPFNFVLRVIRTV